MSKTPTLTWLTPRSSTIARASAALRTCLGSISTPPGDERRVALGFAARPPAVALVPRASVHNYRAETPRATVRPRILRTSASLNWLKRRRQNSSRLSHTVDML